MDLRALSLSLFVAVALTACSRPQAQDAASVEALYQLLQEQGFEGDLESQLTQRLGRELNPALAELGRNLFFDKILALSNDNTCGSCHAPQTGFGDTQSIAIGVSNNNIVGAGRTGPHNQRRTPTVINTAFYPRFMWNGRFAAVSGDPFDNSQGYEFPPPEGTTAFPPSHPTLTHLLIAQGHMPSTELPEMAGFGRGDSEEGLLFVSSRFGGEIVGIENRSLSHTTSEVSLQQLRRTNAEVAAGRRESRSFLQSAPESSFSISGGEDPDPLPAPDPHGSFNEPIRQVVLQRLNDSAEYRQLFAAVFPSVQQGGPIDFAMVGQALAEFQFTLTFARAPVDAFARGDRSALTPAQVRGGLLFFGRAACSSCHTASNELFSNFQNYNIGVPQIAPDLGAGNVVLGGPDQNQDFGLADVVDACRVNAGEVPTCAERYRFRTSPLRNVGFQPTFMHNGAYTRLEDAIRHHLDARAAVANYDPAQAGVSQHLRDRRRMPDMSAILAELDPALPTVQLSDEEVSDLVAFVGEALSDERASPSAACRLVPTTLPSGRTLPRFEGC